jgi:hypothetical protein
MKMVKSLVLGSAAGLLAMSAGAQAADLPVKAKAVEYVRICSLYGAGFFYIPGTDTCIKIGGYLRADLTIHGGASNAPFWSGDPGVNDRYTNNYNDYARMALTIDTRTQTEYGVVRTFGQGDFTFATEGAGNSIGVQSSTAAGNIEGLGFNNQVGGGYTVVEFLFIQFAGFTFGKSASAFNTPWHGFPGNNTAYLVGGYDTVTGLNNIQYTAQFGNGVSATIGVDDSSASDYNRTQIFNAALQPPPGNTTLNNAATIFTNTTSTQASCNLGLYGGASSYCAVMGTAYGGTYSPDIVGNIKVDQAWGLFQLSAALHEDRPGYWAAANTLNASTFLGGVNASGIQTLGHPDAKWGGAISAALQVKNLPTGAGDDVKIEGTWSDGASKYVLGTASALGSSFQILGDCGSCTPVNGSVIGGKMAIGAITDAVYGGFGTPLQSGLQLTQGWGFRGAFNHNWDPYWSTSLFGGIASLRYNDTAKTLWCASFSGTTPNGAPLGLGGIPNAAPVTGAPGITGIGPGYHCDPGFTMSEVGIVTRWTPVKNLTFSGELLYAYLKTNMAGEVQGTLTSAVPVPASATYMFGNMGTASVNLRVQRNF